MEEVGMGFGLTLLAIAVILLTAKLSNLVENFGQPAVLGELVVGMILGNLIFLNVGFFELVKENEVITFLAELGVIILLFQVGLESNLATMRQVGARAGLVAIVGVVVPFVLGTYIVGPLLLPGLDSNAYIFLGATLTATSVGITARVFRDLGRLQDREAQIVLGAAVIDDVLGLIILAVVSAIVTLGSVSVLDIGWIALKALLFLVGATAIGKLMGPYIGAGFSKIQWGIGMKFVSAISACLIFAFLAEVIGLAPIVGAFAAGLVLDPVYFKHFASAKVIEDMREAVHAPETDSETRNRLERIIEHHSHHHVEDLIEPLSYFLVPIFFVRTGMEVNLASLLDLQIILVALGVTIVAFAGKIVAGYVAGDVRRAVVGWGMVPRGEVGLIFASIGQSLGVISEGLFSVIVIMVILSTLITPTVLTILLKRQDAPQDAPVPQQV